MNYELTGLEHMVEQLHPAALITYGHSDDSPKKLDHWLHQIAAEKERVSLALINTSFQLADSKKIEYYIQRHQQGAISLNETITRYANDIIDGITYPVRDAYKKLYFEINLIIEGLISEILKRFTNYVDLDATLPSAYYELARKEISGDLEKIMGMYNRPDVSKELMGIITRPLRNFVSGATAVTSYRTLNYNRELLFQLLMLHEGEAVSYMVYNYQVVVNSIDQMIKMETEMNVKLNILLLYMNFNTPEYTAFCTAGLTRKLKTLPSDGDRIRMLQMYIKFLDLIRHKPGMALMSELNETITQQVKTWINLELHFLREQGPSVNGNGHPTVPDFESNTEQVLTIAKKKIQLMASVAEFALLIKTAPEAEIIQPMAPMELMRNFQSVFTTMGTDENSINNLKNHFFNPKKSAATSLIRKFQSWIKVLRRYE